MNSNTLPSKHILNQRYTIKKAIGQGGFGITYLAFDSLLDQEVCIKELYISGYSSRKEDLTIATTSVQGFSFKELVASFVKEAKKLAKFRHPNIVRVTDVFHANGTAYMVMDYIKGETLSQIIKKGGALIDKKSTDFFYMLLDAVETIHQKKILHRDIKPGNILITKENKLVLIDFGSAREYVDDGSKTHTAMVSKGYSPNEQYTSRALRGPFTDIYSLGATLYYMLTGKIPIEAPARSTEKLLSPNELNPGVSEHLSKVVMKAMEVLPGNRFQTVSSFREALQKITLSEDTVAANQEENTQFEGSNGTTKKISKRIPAVFFQGKRLPIVYLSVFLIVLLVMVGTNQDLKNSIFSSIKEKGDSIPAKPPIKDSIENKIDSTQQDQDGPEDGINKGGTPRKNPPIEPPKVGPNSTSILSKGTIQFGSQQWMVGDLEVSKFRNGDPIYEAKSADEWQLAAKNRIPAWCFYDNDPNKGKLYNWYAVIDSRGLAPIGWHVPSDQEWRSLVSFFGGSKVAAKELKENKGFDAKLSGYRDPDGKFDGRRLTGRWWTRTPFSGQDYAYGQRMRVDNEILSEKFSTGTGFSVRVVKD